MAPDDSANRFIGHAFTYSNGPLQAMFGNIAIGQSGKFDQSPNTKAEFDRDAKIESVREAIERLARTCSLRPDRVCYVFGMGAQPRHVYTSLQGKNGIQLLFFRSLLPWYLRWLSGLVGSYEGLVRIDDLSQLPAVFLSLLDRSMVGVYIFSAADENHFLSGIRCKSNRRQFDLGVKGDPGYCFYIVDADNSESSTGLIEIVSYGIDTPDDLIPA